MENEARGSGSAMRMGALLLAAGLIAGGLLSLRHHRFELMHEMSRMHGGMGRLHQDLWSMEIDLSEETRPGLMVGEGEGGERWLNEERPIDGVGYGGVVRGL